MDRAKIIEWLAGPRDRMEGAALYNLYGKNLRLKRQFAVEDTATAMSILVDEMRKLAGLTEVELAALPRKAKGAVAPTVAKTRTAERVEASAEIGKVITLRERFPFLNAPDCPDELKVAVADMITAHGVYKDAHAAICAVADDADASELCHEVVEKYLLNRELWEELEHYAATGEILGKAVKPLTTTKRSEDLSTLSDVELLRKLQSARTNISKRRKEIESAKGDSPESKRAAESLEQWESRRNMLQAEVDRRKKK